MKAGPYTITQAEAIRRTKRLLASCEPKTAETDFAHRLLEYFTLSVDKGYPVFLQHLIDCYTDKNGADIGEPPDTYENFGWVYPQLLMANLEEKLGQSRISGQVKDDVRQMLSQATNSADLAEEFLKIQALAGAEIDTETLMILHCFAFEIQKTANGPGVLEQLQKCASGADKGAALPGKSKPERKPRKQWTKNAQDKIAAIWVEWRLGHNTKKRGGREVDCFNRCKAELPDCIKIFRDFQDCKECARKNGLIPKYNRKCRKSAG